MTEFKCLVCYDTGTRGGQSFDSEGNYQGPKPCNNPKCPYMPDHLRKSWLAKAREEKARRRKVIIDPDLVSEVIRAARGSR